MFIANAKVFLYAASAFCLGSWIGYCWREKVIMPSFSRHLNVGMKKRATDTMTEQLKRNTSNEVSRLNSFLSSQVTQTCTPQPNVMFLKTHKTASTAVQNVLLRYADKHKLTVGLSTTHDIRFHYGQKFQKEFVRPSRHTINMVFHHMVFDYSEVQKVMPTNTSYITILRDTSSMFESLFDYMHYDAKPFSRIKKQPNALEFWLNHTSAFFHGKNDGHFWWFAKNPVFFDLGYDNLSEDEKYIQYVINEVEKHFGLVLISDYFDESMLLLKDFMCWTMHDVLSLTTNARMSPKTALTDRIVKKINQWNKADAMLYAHFNQTFWKKVDAYGHERMRVDLKLLEEMNAQIVEGCIEGGGVSNKYIKDSKSKVYNPRGVVMSGYNVKESAKNNDTCIKLTKTEIVWTRELMAETPMQ